MGWYRITNLFIAFTRLASRNSIQESSSARRAFNWYPRNIYRNHIINYTKSNIVSEVPSLYAPPMRYYRTIKNQKQHYCPFFFKESKRYYSNLPQPYKKPLPPATIKKVPPANIKKVLQELDKRIPEEFKKLLEDSRIQGLLIYVGTGLAITICFGRWEKIPYSERRHLVILPPKLERKLGEYVFEKEKERFGVNKILSETDDRTVRVKAIANGIIEAVQREVEDDLVGLSDDKKSSRSKRKQRRKYAEKHLKKFNWEITVIDSYQMNAFCCPGGKIVVFTGLLDHFESDVEVATIVGHEIGHAIARHTAEGITKSLWVGILIMVIALFVDSRDAMDAIAKACNYVLTLPNSRRMEKEADYIGLLLMASAGYDPQGAPEVYEKMGRLSGESSRADEYSSTHPIGKNRAKLLSKHEVMNKALRIYKKVQTRRITHPSEENQGLLCDREPSSCSSSCSS